MAVLVSVLPKELQDMVFQMGKVGDELGYKEVRDKVIAVAGHKAKTKTPKPYDRGVYEVGD